MALFPNQRLLFSSSASSHIQQFGLEVCDNPGALQYMAGSKTIT